VLPPHIIIIGAPVAIIFIMDSQRSRSMSMLAPSIGITLQIRPSLLISMVIRHIIGIMPDIVGMPMPDIMGIPMPGIMPIMGMPMPDIMGIPMPGIMPIMGIPMLDIIGTIMGIPMPGIIALWDMGIAGMFIAGIMAVSSLFDTAWDVAQGTAPASLRSGAPAVSSVSADARAPTADTR
jgi:hypothetical protein